jgi:hypothetical protein
MKASELGGGYDGIRRLPAAARAAAELEESSRLLQNGSIMADDPARGTAVHKLKVTLSAARLM